MNTWTPDTSNQDERATVVDVILMHHTLGDWKFLHTDEWEDDMNVRYPGWTVEEFLDKWGPYILMQSDDLHFIVGQHLFSDTWEDE